MEESDGSLTKLQSLVFGTQTNDCCDDWEFSLRIRSKISANEGRQHVSHNVHLAYDEACSRELIDSFQEVSHICWRILEAKDLTFFIRLSGIINILWLWDIDHISENLAIGGQEAGMDTKCEGFSDDHDATVLVPDIWTLGKGLVWRRAFERT